jgi:hypothetical protein
MSEVLRGGEGEMKVVQFKRRNVKDTDCSQRMIGPKLRGRIDALKWLRNWDPPKSFEEEFGDDLRTHKTLREK